MRARSEQWKAAVRKENAHPQAPPHNHPIHPRALHQVVDENQLVGFLKIRFRVSGNRHILIRSGIIGGIGIGVRGAIGKQRANALWVQARGRRRVEGYLLMRSKEFGKG
jgi:predicted acetyltransferase